MNRDGIILRLRCNRIYVSKPVNSLKALLFKIQTNKTSASNAKLYVQKLFVHSDVPTILVVIVWTTTFNHALS